MTQSKYGFKVNGDTVINASFTTDSCGTSIASGSMDTEMTKGKRISDAQKTTQHDILDALGWLPQESEHCAQLAANTLKAAITRLHRNEEGALKKSVSQVLRDGA